MTLKNNRAPLLWCFQLCAWFHCHMWIQTGVRVRKRLSWVLTSVTLTFDLWPWPFAWTSLLTMVITPEIFIMIPWWEHGEKGVTDRQTDGRTDRQTDGLNQSYSCLVAAKKHKSSELLAICEGNPLVWGGYPSQSASGAENSWHRDVCFQMVTLVPTVPADTLPLYQWYGLISTLNTD